MIFFTCQNGHRLHSQTLQSGQWIRCPRCGIVTQIPEQSSFSTSASSETTCAVGTNASTSAAAQSAQPMAPETHPAETHMFGDSSTGSNSAFDSIVSNEHFESNVPKSTEISSETAPCVETDIADRTSRHSEEISSSGVPTIKHSTSNDMVIGNASDTTSEREWEFLCPNGHLLHSTQAFQGRLGECPECHGRFRIPTLGTPPGPSTEATDSRSPDAAKIAGHAGTTGNPFGTGGIGGNVAGLNMERFGESFTRLWELHRRMPMLLELEQGRRVVISEFHADLSDEVLGVFTGYVQSPPAHTTGPDAHTQKWHPTPEKPETIAVPWYSIIFMRFSSELEA